MMGNRVLLLTQWFDPEPGPASLPGVLARGLADRGHSVQVVTGFPNYPTGVLHKGYRIRRKLDESVGPIAVRRVALYPSHDKSTARRLVNYFSFGASAAISGVGAFRDVDVIWVYASPLTLSWPIWATRLLRVPAVLHALDLWPDTLSVSGFDRGGLAARPAGALLSAWSRSMYRAGDVVAYHSPGVGDVLARRGIPRDRLAYVPLWTDEQIFRPGGPDMRVELGIPEDTIVLLYAGTIGAAQGLDSLVEACRLLNDHRILCLVAGSGSSETDLKDQARRGGADNIRFLGRVPSQRMTELMATADLCYIGLRPHPLSAITMPSKTQAVLAAGRAALVAAEGDVADVIAASGAGWSVPPDDAAAIAERVREACSIGRPGLAELGRSGRTFYERTFSVRRGVHRIEELLTDAADRARSRRSGRDGRFGAPTALRRATVSK